MPGPGQKSGMMVLWMRRADEVAFGQQLHAEFGSTIRWRKLMPGIQQGPESPLLADLLTMEGDGAILQRNPGEPILQYRGSRMRSSTATEPAELRSAELGFRWFPAEFSAEVRRDFEALAKSTFRLMRACTLPGRVLMAGKPYRNGRIGKAAFEFVRGENVQLRDASAPFHVLQLRPEA